MFDTDYAGRLVLGKHWRTATPAQRQQFIDAFYDFLLRSYARYVLRFEKDKVKILPPQPAVRRIPSAPSSRPRCSWRTARSCQ